MRVRATGSPRAHPLEVVGHGRRSPRIPKPVDGRPTWQVARCQACNTQSDEAQATAIQHERSSLRCRRAVLLELDSCSAVSGDGARVRVASQAGSGGRCAKDRAQGLLAEGKKINLAVGAQWHSKKKEKKLEGQVRSWGGASRSDPRSAADPQGVGRTGLSSAHLVLHPPSPRSTGHRSISDRVPSLRGVSQ